MKFPIFLTILSLHLFFSTANNTNPVISTIEDLPNSVNIIGESSLLLSQHSQSKAKAKISARTSATPELVQLISTQDTVYALQMIVSPNGGILFLYDSRSNGYQVYDISNPVIPLLLSSVLLDRFATGLALAMSSDGKTGFAIYSDLNMKGELLIIDLSKPISPIIIANCSIASTNSASITLSADDKTLFVGTSSGGFSENNAAISITISIFDVSDLESPRNISSIYYAPNEEILSIYITLSLDGRTLFMVNGASLYVFNVSNSRQPEQINKVTLDLGMSLVMAPDGENLLILTSHDGRYGINEAQLLVGSISDLIFTEACSFLMYGTGSFGTFGLMAMSPNNPNNLYLAAGDLYSIDISNIKQPICNPIKTIEHPGMIVLSPDGKIAFVAYDGVGIINLYFEAEVRLYMDILAEIPSPFDQNSSSTASLAVSSESNTVFIQSASYLEIINVTNITSPTILSIFNITSTAGDCYSITISPDDKSAFIICNTEIMILNISNLSMPVPISTIINESEDGQFIVSPDEQVGFLTTEAGVQILNISNLTSPNNLSRYEHASQCASITFALSTDASVAILVSDCLELEFIDISNLTLPIHLSSVDLSCCDTDSETDDQVFIAITPDDQEITAVSTYPPFYFDYYEASDPTFPEGLNQPILINAASSPIAFSSDAVTAFWPDWTGVPVVDISILTAPAVLRLLPIPYITSLQLSADESTLFLSSQNSTFTALNLNPDCSLYLFQTNFILGEVYPINFMPLKFESPGNFSKLNNQQNFSVIQISLYTIGQNDLPIYSNLPSWITYEADQGTLTFAPSGADQVGLYQIYAIFSTMIPTDVFVGIGNITNETESMDLIVLMMSLGYIDTDRFLALNFGPNKPLFLTSQYSGLQDQIQEALLEYYIETIAKVSVSSFLYLEMVTYISTDASQASSKVISIQTKSQNTISVTIHLNASSGGIQPQFVSNNYPIIATISDNQTTINMQGSLTEINLVLKQLIINLENGITSCNGTFTISDGLNPILTQTVIAISDYFVLNTAPVLNSNFSIQAQVSQTPIQTGEQFLINLAPMFVDLHNQALVYSLTMQDSTQDVPEWLMIRGDTIMGTPPEQFSPSTIDLVVTASNQFKSLGKPFTINIRISLIYGLKLVATYGGALISIVGLWIYIWKIYNICCKRRYRYPKNFVIRVGDKSSVESICAISFIAEEIEMSKLIFKEIMNIIAKELKVKSVNDDKIVNYFVNPSSQQLEEEKLARMIKYGMAVVRNKEKVKKGSGNGFLKLDVITQIIMNEIVFKQLYSEHEALTRKAFEVIKNDWIYLVETVNDALEYKVNTEKLEEKLQILGLTSYKAEGEIDLGDMRMTKDLSKKLTVIEQTPKNENKTNLVGKSSNGESLLNENEIGTQKAKLLSINIELLEQAIRAIAFNYHNLDVNAMDIEIIVNQKSQISCCQGVREFFKRDLNEIKFAKGSNAGYGIKYEVRKGVLRFYGVPDEDLKDKTLVIQIVNKRSKIKRELWINCVGQGVDEEETLNKEQSVF